MGLCLTIACYLITFSPSAALFCRFVAKDPLRIILFVLGAFFWLASLLLCSFIWVVISTIGDALPVAVLCSIFLQDAARIFYFWLLKKAQRGLNKITRPGSKSIAPGVSDLHNARHMLALVCGLGMGVMAALVLTMNVFAEFAGPGTIGLPRAMEFWDSCHKVKQAQFWALPAIAATAVHIIVSVASWYNSSGHQETVLSIQFILLLCCIFYSHIIMGGTLYSMLEGVRYALMDWVTLKWFREKILKKEQTSFLSAEEMEAEERRVIYT
ncbi:bis(5'-nucleosidyl)-tetraphosphatase [Parelaphostrongylus tenuis]|uniref:Bis(5'-nucleosidyl)-tetraphosphatase n=1 Tax=Parelaphostrongylus tenuis TaxID=148309 RepID=A0AAD5QTE0_PARTN|nr:bis(5'-nucleosidyl)-tetraphosphatase [Parelaphostrongylus tenuis]